MKKTFIIVLIFLGLFLVKSVGAKEISAASIEGWLDNRAGSIPVTVTVNFYRNNNSSVLPAVVQTVAAGARQFITKTDSSDIPPYRITWSTACNFGSQNNVTGSGGVYIFSDQDVHCTQVNASVSITEASCPANTGTIKWKMVNVGTSTGSSRLPTFSTVFVGLKIPGKNLLTAA